MNHVFVDMDGVLADFDGGYEQRFGIRPSKSDDNVDWNLVRGTESFFRDLPPMPDFEELWEGLRPYSPIILTGTPREVEPARSNKREWVDRVIGKDVLMIACPSRDKNKFIQHRGDILIDDWEKYMSLWIDRGGNWITHTSAKNSLQMLKKLKEKEKE